MQPASRTRLLAVLSAVLTLLAFPARTTAISCNQAVYGNSGADLGDGSGSTTVRQSQVSVRRGFLATATTATTKGRQS